MEEKTGKKQIERVNQLWSIQFILSHSQTARRFWILTVESIGKFTPFRFGGISIGKWQFDVLWCRRASTTADGNKTLSSQLFGLIYFLSNFCATKFDSNGNALTLYERVDVPSHRSRCRTGERKKKCWENVIIAIRSHVLRGAHHIRAVRYVLNRTRAQRKHKWMWAIFIVP